MKKEIAHKSVLGGKAEVSVGDSSLENNYSKEHIKKVLEEKGLSAEEHFTVTNPVTNKKMDITIRRDGTQDSEVAIALANPDATQEQKETAVAAWLFERGKESASFLAEIFRYKGAHTKETRVFKAQVRQDVDSISGIIAILFQDVAKTFYKDLSIETYEVKDKTEPKGFRTAFKTTREVDTEEIALAIARFSSRLEQAAELIVKTIQHNTYERERALGKHVYVDGTGRPYMVGEDGTVFYAEDNKKEE